MKPAGKPRRRPARSLKLRPGDYYEDCAFHPCLCTRVDGFDVEGISLIDGSGPRCCDRQHCGLRKLSLAQAMEIKAKGLRWACMQWDQELVAANGQVDDTLLDPANPDAHALRPEPLSVAAFAPFGEVIAPDAARTQYGVNDGTSQRFHALGRVTCDGGAPVISIFRAQPRALPFAVRMLERHPRGSQAFVPLSDAPYLVVVADDPSTPPRCFLARGQGVNFRAGTWHHPLLALERTSDFLVVDREGDGDNCDEATLAEAWMIADQPCA